MLLGAERLLEGWGLGWMMPDFGAVVLDGLSGFWVVLDWFSGAGAGLDGWPFVVLAECLAWAAGAWDSSISSPFMVY